ncbi:DNA translocase FtsK [Facklamia hominis]|uniref:DNA translocase FtsK n=1 Tax=Facklamia hominis TaxID=178214 RepID=A0AAJ1Q5Y9_9LACT|nr:DNA translocase FtsK [Facklamia hominis]MDK7187138.1 DNA translocase FtsK [Facklamia hominis]
MTVGKKNNSNAKKKKQSQVTYQNTYLILGLIIVFLSLVSVFNWGMVGVMMTNGFRLLVGETYTLVLAFAIWLGLALIVRGRMVRIEGRQVIGGIFVLMALTGILHISTFYSSFSQQTGQSIFAYTFQLYKNELLTWQIVDSLGGGLLGALLYQGLIFLVGRWGSYLLLWTIFFMGLILVINQTLYAAWQTLRYAGEWLFKGLRKINPDLQQIKQVFNDENNLNDQNYSQEEISTSLEDIQVAQDSSKKRSISWIMTPFEKFKHFFFGDSDQEAVDLSQDVSPQSDQTARYMPSVERDEEPVFQPNTPYDFEPYKLSDPKAHTASVKRKMRPEQERILDLDFFDQIQQQRKTSNEQREQVSGPLKTIIKENLEHHDQPSSVSQSTRSSASPSTESQVTDPSMTVFPEVSKLPEDKANEFEKQADTKISEVDQTGRDDDSQLASFSESSKMDQSQAQRSHWQEASHQTQELIQDDSPNATAPNIKQSKKIANKKLNQEYQFPGVDLLNKMEPVDQTEEYERIEENIKKLELTFESFGVDAKIVKANLGPAVTKYEIQPAIGVKVSKIVNLADDIALALAARDVRIEAPIPGKSLIGIEVPNSQVSPVAFSEIIEAGLASSNKLEVPLGRDISGSVCLADLSKMPHLLVAGATGSGKSVGINVIICSILMKARPDEVKFLMVDPKKVELTLYNDLPHQLSPVVTNPRKAARALNNVVEEMERRYELFATTGVRNIDGYNEQVDSWNQENGTGYERLPKIVVVIDELADLMMVASNDVENAIIRLAQMARAAGIHMIIATQRPSVDVITGIIKANVPSRLAFAVSSGTDSRTIIDSVGAEKLLGRGDMLFQPMGKNKPVRVQGAYISDDEVERITDYIKMQQTADYDEKIVVADQDLSAENASDDEYYEEAVDLISDQETVSISQLQRKFRIGYNRAARLIDDLEANGLVSAQDGSKPRQVLIEGDQPEG